MADTIRTDAAILALLANNTVGAISAQDIRDSFVTVTARVPISVKQFGAVGDGETDDTAAFLDAISSCEEADGKKTPIYIPPGDYAVGQLAFTSGATNETGYAFIGAGIENTTLSFTVTDDDWIDINGLYNRVEGMTLRAHPDGGHTTGNAIHWFNGVTTPSNYGLVLKDLWIKNPPERGVYLRVPEHAICQHVNVIGAGKYGFHLDGGGGSLGISNILTQCRALQCNWSGLRVDNTSYIYAENFQAIECSLVSQDTGNTGDEAFVRISNTADIIFINPDIEQDEDNSRRGMHIQGAFNPIIIGGFFGDLDDTAIYLQGCIGGAIIMPQFSTTLETGVARIVNNSCGNMVIMARTPDTSGIIDNTLYTETGGDDQVVGNTVILNGVVRPQRYAGTTLRKTVSRVNTPTSKGMGAFEGAAIYDTTLDLPLFKAGDTAISSWKKFDGTVAYRVGTNIRTSGFIWTASGSGTNEYYVTLTAGANPNIASVTAVHESDATAMVQGTLGSLTAGQYRYGDNDTLGFSTIYVRLSDGADPDSKADGYVRYNP